MNDYLALALGVIAAAVGGELFVRGAVGLAQWARIPAGIIGATVAAFATSSPELSVSISSALDGKPQLALGDALGSNVVNVGLILALALIISGIQAPRDSIKRDFSIALLVPVITGALIVDGVLSRVDGLILLSLFLAWLVAVILEVRKQRSLAGQVLGERHRWAVVVSCAAGLTLLIVAGRLIVSGAKGIATAYGLDEFVVGATIVSVGTSMPELATTLISKIRKHDEVGLGTVLGSNIFNGLWIVACAAIITPIVVDWREVAVGLVFGVMVVIFIFPSRQGLIERRRGVLLLALYLTYLATLLQFRQP